jgi:hypothetical protein
MSEAAKRPFPRARSLAAPRAYSALMPACFMSFA